ncbi:MAG: class I SAM-dependent methyltransferase [Pseudomonadota bacterium]
MAHSERRLKQIFKMTGAKTYLEVGVFDGATFNALKIDHKDAVDPVFRFDVPKFETKTARFFEMTSDEFMVNHVGDRVYDVIFLDGLHTFEQTFRDFCMSLSCAHKNTVWLIDDVHPLDVFSAHRDQRTAINYRAQTGSTRKAWHGDVYKTIFAIHDFFPNFVYRSFATGGNQQTVLMQRPRAGFKPVYNDLERISRVDFYEFMDRRPLLNLEPEDDVFKWLQATLKG